MAVTYPKVVFSTLEFSNQDIQSAKLTEEFNPLSITVPINAFEFTIYSADTDMAIANLTGDYEVLKKKEPLALYEYVNGTLDFLGVYYIDDMNSPTENSINIKCVDILGILDGLDYVGGIWTTGITAGDLIDQILTPIGVKYALDPDLADITLYGWIPYGSYREALQQIAFALGAFILTSRRDYIEIGQHTIPELEELYKRTGVFAAGQSSVRQWKFRGRTRYIATEGTVVSQGIRSGVARAGQSRTYQKRWRLSTWSLTPSTFIINNEDQSGDRRLKLRPFVSAVEVIMHDIVIGTGIQKLYDGELQAGTHRIIFKQPMHTLSVTGATITESGANYAILSVPTTGTVTLSGQVYEDTVSSYKIQADIPQGEKENIKKIKDATLVNSNNGEQVATRVFNYYAQRYLHTCRLYSSNAQVGSAVQIETIRNYKLQGLIERGYIDLTGGYKLDAEITGVIL
jgi:hypothetical protein